VNYFSPTGFFETGEKLVYELTTTHGQRLKMTEDHQILTPSGMVPLHDLVVGDDLVISNNRRDVETRLSPVLHYQYAESGWIVGSVLGDGCYNPAKYHGLVRFWGETAEHMAQQAWNMLNSYQIGDFAYHASRPSTGPTYNKINETWEVQSKKIDLICHGLLDEHKNILPTLEEMPLSWLSGFLAGLYDADGTIVGDTLKGGLSIQLTQVNKTTLEAVQRMLLQFGIVSRLYSSKPAGKKFMPDGRGGQKEYDCQQAWRLDVSRDNLELFAKLIGFTDPRKWEKLEDKLHSKIKAPYREKFVTQVAKIEEIGIEKVYDCQVTEIHQFVANGLTVHNCGEIVLRPNEFCNLTEVIVRPDDTLETLMKKVEWATIIGTFQSTLTNFRYLRPIWRKNCEEERLLGVSLTGIMDNRVTAGLDGPEILKTWLAALKAHTVAVNAEWAKKLGIPPSAAITCTKPSGTVSQLVDSSSGIHPRFSHYYVRTVRNDKKDPLAEFMIAAGIPAETDVTKESTWVFSFPIKSPDTSRVASDMSAVDQLEHYLIYNHYWTEHNPSITVYVREHEWLEVAAWVYKHFDEINGISFLPYTDNIYKQAPFQAISKIQYDELVSKFPVINFDNFQIDEHEDNTTGVQSLSCSSGVCDII
jgi:hypothetical protein